MNSDTQPGTPDPSKDSGQTSNTQPAAYDPEGRPLYYAPPAGNSSAPQVVHMTRALDPVMPEVSPEHRQRHDESCKRYPNLNLSEQEFIISAVRRHPIGLFLPVAATIFLLALVGTLLAFYPTIVEAIGWFDAPSYTAATLCGLLIMLLVLIGGYAVVWVYLNNRFYLTNESVIQEIQTGLFSRNEQTVSLANIEDASFEQVGILQSILNYGSIRLSTEGDETTYRFYYVADPKREIAVLNNAVEAFKNGRPIDPNENPG